ncbi:hypothetical protein AVEN_213050-1 [Araneus ventricosus]|uniref:Uncharacterized protein n=1 Tax=Araneus ventricosus TaxID=182803 RepID=A0A4Y2QCM7_ARAVE|nr:hypothetical protein AVEN_213050-1 [Araneus ventricosus]
MVGKRFTRVPTGLKAMIPDLGDKMKFQKIQELSLYLYYERRCGDSSEIFHMSSRPVGKTINTELQRKEGDSLLGLLALRIGQMLEAEGYC